MSGSSPGWTGDCVCVTDQYDKRCRSIRSANGSGDKTKKEDTGDERNRKWYGIYCFDVNAGGEGNN